MVRAADIEGLLKKYVEENSLERADALYLLVTVGKEAAAKTLTARYGVSGALSSVLEDLKVQIPQIKNKYHPHSSRISDKFFRPVEYDLLILGIEYALSREILLR